MTVDDTKPVGPDNAHQTTPPADTLPEWLHNRYSRYQPGMLPWAELGADDQAYWAHEAAAVRRAVVRGGFRIDPTEQLPDGTPLSWEQRARKAEYTIERMQRTNRMVNGSAKNARERAEAAEGGIDTAHRVVDHWRQAMTERGNTAAAHALAMVEAALNGERDPDELGMPAVDAGSAEGQAMTAAVRCEFSGLPTDTCAHCLGHADPDQQDAKDRARLIDSGRGWIPAVYPGTCEHCGERFGVGTAIRMEGPRGWRAECCSGGTS